MSQIEFNLGRLLEQPMPVNTRPLIPSTIYRLAAGRRDWKSGRRDISVEFRPSVRGAPKKLQVTVIWDLGELALEHGYHQVREDLRKLAKSTNDNVITELAPVGTAFVLVTSLMQNDKITRIVQIGGRGDFYLNGRRDEMIEISGTVRGNLNTRFAEKKAQILLNQSLRKAIVSVTRFASPASRLERVK